MHSNRVLMVSAVLALAIGGGRARAAEYDVAAYLARVEAANSDIVLARGDVRAAEEGVKQALSALLPAVAVQGSYTRNLSDIEQPKAVGASTTAAGPIYPFVYQDVDTNYDNELLLSVGLRQKIFDAESLARYEQARKGRAAQHLVYEVTRRNVRSAAKRLYAQAQLARAVVAVDEVSERTAEDNYRSAAAKYRAGVATELDVLSAEVEWKSRVPATAEARRNAELSMIALKELAGIPLSEKVVLTEDAATLPDDPPDPGLDQVLAARPDYAAYLRSRDIADVARRAASGAFLPTVSLSFAYTHGIYRGYASSSDEYDYTPVQLGVSVTLPIATGGYRLSLMQSAKINLDRAATEIAKKRDDIERELVSVRLRLDEARRRIDSARLVEEAARRAAERSKASFANGLATQLQVAQAATNLDQALVGVHNAIYQYKAAYYDWELATGKPD